MYTNQSAKPNDARRPSQVINTEPNQPVTTERMFRLSQNLVNHGIHARTEHSKILKTEIRWLG